MNEICLYILIGLVSVLLVLNLINRRRYVNVKELKRLEKEYLELVDIYHYVASENTTLLEKKIKELKELISTADKKIKSLNFLCQNNALLQYNKFTPTPFNKPVSTINPYREVYKTSSQEAPYFIAREAEEKPPPDTQARDIGSNGKKIADSHDLNVPLDPAYYSPVDFNSNHGEIFRLREEGMHISQIARKTNKSKGEVNLILALRQFQMQGMRTKNAQDLS